MSHLTMDRAHCCKEAAPMAYTLNLVDELLARAVRLHDAGQWREALHVLHRLECFDLSPTVAEQIHARQGMILLKRRRYRAARQHLRAALRLRPDCARYHFLLGLAQHIDPAGNRERAARHYRRSLRLAPRQVRCRGKAGLLAIEQGRPDEGVALLRQAVAQAPGDAGAVGRLVKGLCLAGRRDDALAAARTALFQAPRCQRLRSLWANLHFAGLRRQQEIDSARQAADEEPRLLPFIRLVDGPPATATGIRHDAAQTLPGPHLLRLRPRLHRRRVP
jgi:tetratricopeptide (TPR) repeat protein